MNGLRRKEARRRGLLVLARGQKRRQIVFLVWVDLSEHKWVILAERRGRPAPIGESNANKTTFRFDVRGVRRVCEIRRPRY